MICSGVNRFLLMSNSFQLPKSYHRRWNDLRTSGQISCGILGLILLSLFVFHLVFSGTANTHRSSLLIVWHAQVSSQRRSVSFGLGRRGKVNLCHRAIFVQLYRKRGTRRQSCKLLQATNPPRSPGYLL